MPDAKSKASKSSEGAPKVHPAIEAAQVLDQAVSPVQPITTVRNVPVDGDETAEEVQVFNRPNLQQDGEVLVPAEEDKATANQGTSSLAKRDLCWNCANHGTTTELGDDGACDVCGFEKEKLYNGTIEQQKAHERALAEQY